MSKETAPPPPKEPGGGAAAPPANTPAVSIREVQTDAAAGRDGNPAAAAGLRVSIVTLGCKINQYEAAAMAEDLESRGYRPFNALVAADFYIINTCTVTGGADFQSRQLIRRAQKLNPRAPVVVTGCYAQTAPHVFTRMPGVAVVAGMGEKNRMAEVIAAAAARPGAGSAAGKAPEVRVTPPTAAADKEAEIPPVSSFPGHTRAFLKIQDGCDAFCSYCIVPYARGRSRSIGAGEVIRRIENLARHGYREVVLTGIHLGAYGADRRDGSTLAGLLRHVERYQPVERLRLSSLEPGEIDDDILAVMSGARIVCPHLHVPLQSGDDAVLKAMGRNYDHAFFRALLEKVTTLRPDMTVGLDVMAGFPGEDEQAFANTLALISALPVAYLHVFPYSRRPGTAAARMDGQVREEDKKRRTRSLRELDRVKRRRHLERFVGAVLPVLVEGRQHGADGRLRGLSHNYLSVILRNGEGTAVNRIVKAKIEGLAAERTLLGTPVHG
ncbi:MAG TPA: tRNA (N(6)-L-threonylcarbamoyladenosine(37)-C(2))-methylthiotransferase MtaB [Syntrophales bacterium]|nr:tRNA (N(6)-L-threonylcarbamoyladenosine(37)-C(2))-methylthiotransferase MtaB [Syntrophales bacterium]